MINFANVVVCKKLQKVASLLQVLLQVDIEKPHG